MDDKLKEIENTVLKERALRLAEPIREEGDRSETTNVLVFRAIGTRYAVNLSCVDAVLRIFDIMPVPGTPRHIPGVIRRRGATTALVSLRFFFFPQTEGLIDEDLAVVVTARRKTFALQVEDVEGVQPLIKSQLRPVPDNYVRAVAPYLMGVTPDGMALLDMDRIVSSEGFGTTRIEGQP